MDCRSCFEALTCFTGKPPALRGLSSQLKQMKKDTLVLRLIAVGLLRRLLVGHFGSHAVAGLPNLLPSQAIVSRSTLTNRRSKLGQILVGRRKSSYPYGAGCSLNLSGICGGFTERSRLEQIEESTQSSLLIRRQSNQFHTGILPSSTSGRRQGLRSGSLR